MSIFADAHNLVINGGVFNAQQALEAISDQRSEAFKMLQRAGTPSASYDSSERYPAPRCHPDTRNGIISIIRSWIKDTHVPADILWLYGPAGAGKSAIAQTISEECRKKKLLGASFFFSRISADRSDESRLIATLVYQIAVLLPEFKTLVVDALIQDPTIFSKSIEAQADKLLVETLNKVKPVFSFRRWRKVIVIDGLDECHNREAQRRILRIISRALKKKFPFCFLICSRPEADIRDMFASYELRGKTRLVGLDDSFQAREDIRIYLRNGFTEIQKRQFHNGRRPANFERWPSDDVIEALVYKSSGYFIYASTVLNFVGDRLYHPGRRLEIIMGNLDRGLETPFEGLDQLYIQILSSLPDISLTMRVLGVLQFLRKPLLYDDLEMLLGLYPGDLYRAVSDLQSILAMPDPMDRNATSSHFTFHHKSFSDFLFDPSRSGNLCVYPEMIQTDLTLCCLRALGNLKGHDRSHWTRNDHYRGIEISEYAVRYWIDHLIKSLGVPELVAALREINLVQWLNFIVGEGALSLLNRIPEVIRWLEIGSYSEDVQQQEILLTYEYISEMASMEHYFNLILDSCSEMDWLAALCYFDAAPALANSDSTDEPETSTIESEVSIQSTRFPIGPRRYSYFAGLRDEEYTAGNNFGYICTKILHFKGDWFNHLTDGISSFSSFLTVNSFLAFLNDSVRCKHYYSLAGIHASITICMLRQIMQAINPDFENGEMSSLQARLNKFYGKPYIENFDGAFHHSLSNWSFHLSRAYPTQELVVYLQEVYRALKEPINLHRLWFYCIDVPSGLKPDNITSTISEWLMTNYQEEDLDSFRNLSLYRRN